MPYGNFIKLQSILFLLLRSKKNYLCQAPFVHGVAKGYNANDTRLLQIVVIWILTLSHICKFEVLR